MALFNYECDETKRIIEEVSPNYPQLTTYEKEWLYFHKYHYIPGIPVELEYETVNVNPTGMVQNAIPYQYKSAILKGMTLVNKIPNPTSISYEADKKVVFAWNSDFLFGAYHCYNVANWSREITVISTTGKPITVEWLTDNGLTVEWCGVLSSNIINKKLILPSNCTSISISGLKSKGWSLDNAQQANVVVLDGHHTIENIPYFEGMQSVKMPVLTTSNGDGTKTNILIVNEELTLRSKGEVYDELDLLTGRLTQRIDENNEVLAQAVVKTVDLTTLTKPYEGTNHYHLTANIPCVAILEVPVVSTGKQTIKEINN